MWDMTEESKLVQSIWLDEKKVRLRAGRSCPSLTITLQSESNVAPRGDARAPLVLGEQFVNLSYLAGFLYTRIN